ncbi:MAG TPA: SET domain-containing protein [Candidatus Paceibacterota bacterium]|nr:SET domain-containing protein [Candidatus Paceibacterota bacterium]
MLLVKTKIGPNAIAGIGIFADEFIPKGTVMWEFKEGFDLRFDEKFLQSLSKPSQKLVLNYIYKNPGTGLYVLCADDARFFNHSETPSVEDIYFTDSAKDSDGITIAARDLEPGDEITCDYRSFDADWKRHLGEN